MIRSRLAWVVRWFYPLYVIILLGALGLAIGGVGECR